MVTIVNGYTCFTSCDVEAARQGRDPAKPIGSPPDDSAKHTKSVFDTQPATLRGGALPDADASDPTSVLNGNSTGAPAASTVDRLA